MAFTIGRDDKIIFFADHFFQLCHYRSFLISPAVVINQAAPESPFFLLGRPLGSHSLEDAPKSVPSFQISKQFLKSLIIGKKMQSFRDRQPVAGSDQNRICLFNPADDLRFFTY